MPLTLGLSWKRQIFPSKIKRRFILILTQNKALLTLTQAEFQQLGPIRKSNISDAESSISSGSQSIQDNI